MIVVYCSNETGGRDSTKPMPLVTAACCWHACCRHGHTLSKERGDDTPEWLRDLKLIYVPVRVQLRNRVVHRELPPCGKLLVHSQYQSVQTTGHTQIAMMITGHTQIAMMTWLALGHFVNAQSFRTHLLVFPVESQRCARILNGIVITGLCMTTAHINLNDWYPHARTTNVSRRAAACTVKKGCLSQWHSVPERPC